MFSGTAIAVALERHLERVHRVGVARAPPRRREASSANVRQTIEHERRDEDHGQVAERDEAERELTARSCLVA